MLFAPLFFNNPAMTQDLLQALCAYIPRDRVESIIRPGTPLPEDGVALIADISGFTPLTEALTHGLSADQGAEELTRALDGVFTPLIEEIHAYHGSVIKFGGDALIVWYAREPRGRRAAVIRRALTSAWRMQRAIKTHGRVPTPIGVVTLKMKVGLTYGPAKRFKLGLSKYGYEDVLGGRTLDRMAEAGYEHCDQQRQCDGQQKQAEPLPHSRRDSDHDPGTGKTDQRRNQLAFEIKQWITGVALSQ